MEVVLNATARGCCYGAELTTPRRLAPAPIGRKLTYRSQLASMKHRSGHSKLYLPLFPSSSCYSSRISTQAKRRFAQIRTQPTRIRDEGFNLRGSPAKTGAMMIRMQDHEQRLSENPMQFRRRCLFGTRLRDAFVFSLSEQTVDLCMRGHLVHARSSYEGAPECSGGAQGMRAGFLAARHTADE